MDKRKKRHIFLYSQIMKPKNEHLNPNLYLESTFWKSPLTTASAVKSGAGLPMAALRSPWAETRDAMNSIKSLILKLFNFDISDLNLIRVIKLNSLVSKYTFWAFFLG